MPNDSNNSSMTYWWPLVQDCGVPMPRTEMVPVGGDISSILDGGDFPERLVADVTAACERMGYPAFLRSDRLSGKHEYIETCYVPGPEKIAQHICAITEEHAMSFDLPMPEAFAVREFLELDAPFKAFNGLPIARERRYFIRDGAVVCHHPYWPADAMRYPSRPDWRTLLAALSVEEHTGILTDYSMAIGRRLTEFWSVDFAQTKSGAWYFIDAARGENSWHPEHGAVTPADAPETGEITSRGALQAAWEGR